MNNEDRKRVFWLLKKYSSYTLWKSMGDAYQEFTNAWEYAVKKAAPEDQDEFIVDALKDLWDACVSFDKGLPMLNRGDRYIFSKMGKWLIFNQIEYATRLMDERDYVHEWMVNEKQAKLLFEKLDRISYGPGWITEPREGRPAALKSDAVFYTNTWPPKLDYCQFGFPDNLPTVPEPTTDTVDTGREVTITGIWEPEWADSAAPKSVLNNVRSLFAPSMPQNVQKGCMNYLLAGTTAPPYQDGEKLPVMPVRWRLIWEDTRYRDGTIPEEEKEYLSVGTETLSYPVIEERLRGLPGETVPRAGKWWTPALPANHATKHFEQGDRFPEAASSYGTVVWYFAPREQAVE